MNWIGYLILILGLASCTICGLLFGIWWASQKSVPAGGCVASGRVRSPVAVDAGQVGTGLDVREIFGFDGGGYYLEVCALEVTFRKISNPDDFNRKMNGGVWYKLYFG